ncbi:CaiB/BaiF CoA transferase family protein [Halopenitus persicus]|uniref:CaiB/BaiF CoA transferase family protein n=1 Tax=Halopenitus persicus TaxID=1048396 RepID=UPI000BBA8B7A|nr:CaiB/BaiF CoA-transferase family protein [Halopenitus persicus]
MEQKLLENITVVEVASFLTAPFATSMMGDLGADVIKVESPAGDITRGVGPKVGGMSAYFASINRNKRPVTLNLKSDEGKAVFRDIVEQADVLVENLKAGTMDRFGLGYDDMSEINNNLVYCSIKGFHSDSQYGDMPAMDLMMQGMSGTMSVTGEEDGPPVNSWVPIGDFAPSMYACQSILAALYARDVGNNGGKYIEVPMLDTLISWTSARMAYSFATEKPYPRGKFHTGMAPFGTLETADSYIVITVSSDALWPRLCRAIDREDLIDDERFKNNMNRVENSDELYSILGNELEAKTTEEWFELMREYEVPAAPVYDTLDMWDDPYIQERDLRARVPREDEDEQLDILESPVEFDGERPSIRIPPKNHGADTEQILSEYGYSQDKIRELKENDVI